MVISERVYQHLHIHIIRLQTHNVLSAENLEVSCQIPHTLFDWKSEYAFRTLCEGFAFLKFFSISCLPSYSIFILCQSSSNIHPCQEK